MAKGRKAKPTALKVLEGNPGKRPLNHLEPKPFKPKKYKVPKGLTKRGRKIWTQTLKVLQECGIMTEADQNLLTRYADTMSRWEELQQIANKKGEAAYFTYNSAGNLQSSPVITQMRHLSDILIKMEAELGLTPAGRPRLKVSMKVEHAKKISETESIRKTLGIDF